MLSDWESDLTELSSDLDEEEYVPPTQRKKTTTRNTGSDYKITNTLRPPRTTQYTAKSLFDQIVDSTIDLEPEYQRDIVWPESKQSGLIDSILRNYYIPPVIFAVTAKEDGSETRTCIDGKQRLTSIAKKSNTRYWQYQQVFANKQITCVEYESLSDDQERKFSAADHESQRVQLGVALTAAERLQALTGIRATLVREIQAKVLGEQGFGSNLEWANGRGRDFQCLASIVYLIEQQPLGFPTPMQLDKWLQSFESDVMETFQVWLAMVRDRRYNTPFSKPTRVSPIEFTLIGVLIHKNRSKLSLLQLSNAIWQMRADVRSHHVDIRANTKVCKTMFDFIKKMKTTEFQGDGKGDTPATTAVKNKPGESGTATTKRKRAIESSSEEEDSSDDEDHVPLRRKVPAKKKVTTSKTTTVSKSSTSAKPAATTSSSKSTTTKATSNGNSKVTVKQVIAGPSAKSVKLSLSSDTYHSDYPVDTMTASQAKPSPSGGTSTSPAPLALPEGHLLPMERRSTVSITSVSSPIVNRGEGAAASPNDRLAVLRAAKASVGTRSFSAGSPVVPAAGQSISKGGQQRLPPNILDNERPRLPISIRAFFVPQMTTEQVAAMLSSIPPNVINAIQNAQQSASAPSTPNPGVPTAFPRSMSSRMPSTAPEPPSYNQALKRSPSTPAQTMPPTKPAAMRTPPPGPPPGPRPSVSTMGQAGTITQLSSPSSLPPPPPSLPPPPVPSLPPPPLPVSPSLSAKSASSGNMLARPMSERDRYSAGGSASPKSSVSRGRGWEDRDVADWDMDRNRDREREWNKEQDWDRDRGWDSRRGPDRSADPRRRDSGGMRDWERERSERDRDWSWRGARGRGRGRGWSRGW
ncbi:uncharacterized protein B0H18DRAFT_1033507 [Fomitopsis serialis]|uniref:uncharacterized protein n=1 Tax=Fomitopsis serialis TaxID=139415 RepID=UPI0020088631|nr:uncharacterized protein B0H18DRAFT_1033507 [Neoantrodia serialis]KAH9917716.1 hypothetical protein B0H18DRAFT_1033507 [Neoantrodia serialis]